MRQRIGQLLLEVFALVFFKSPDLFGDMANDQEHLVWGVLKHLTDNPYLYVKGTLLFRVARVHQLQS